MEKKQKSATNLVRDIWATDADEIQCEEAHRLMVRCAGQLLSEAASRQQYPSLWRHFHFCPDCAAEYEMVMELSRLEAAGQLEQPARIPPLPTGAQRPRWSWAQDALKVLFPGFSPAAVAAVRQQRTLNPIEMEPIVLELAGGQMAVTLELYVQEDNPARRELFCTVAVEEKLAPLGLEGVPVWLQEGEEGPAVQSQELDAIGDARFTDLQAGVYTLRLELGDQEYGVTGITIP